MNDLPMIDAIGLVASDLARTVTFYRAAGCVLPDPDANTLDEHLECDLGGLRLMIDSEDVMKSFSEDTCSPTDVDRLHGELSALGAGSHLPPFDAPWGQRYATVRDPDGVRVDLYASASAD